MFSRGENFDETISNFDTGNDVSKITSPNKSRVATSINKKDAKDDGHDTAVERIIAHNKSVTQAARPVAPPTKEFDSLLPALNSARRDDQPYVDTNE